MDRWPETPPESEVLAGGFGGEEKVDKVLGGPS